TTRPSTSLPRNSSTGRPGAVRPATTASPSGSTRTTSNAGTLRLSCGLLGNAAAATWDDAVDALLRCAAGVVAPGVVFVGRSPVALGPTNCKPKPRATPPATRTATEPMVIRRKCSG